MSSRRWLRRLAFGCGALIVLVVAAGVGGWLWYRAQVLDSGGPLRPRQAAYDVRRYDLAVAIDPKARTIRGENRATLAVVAPLDAVELQLDGHLTVESAAVDGAAATFTHRDGLITIPLAAPWKPGERHVVDVVYGGHPKVAARPPWLDGFVWDRTPSGAPWLGVTTEGDGGDDWWPCKDHPSDEPDEGMSIALTLPAGLVGLSNGRKVGETDNGDGTVTTRWEVHYPINNYDVTFNAGPYVPVEEPYHGVAGDRDETIVFWALPEHLAAARTWWRQAPKILSTLGRRFGEYPFFDDKYWVVDAPYKGMEHQTLVAYGGNFEDNRFGFDSLLLHETAHEWWGNDVTARDWADFWIHEGFATYAEALYVDDTLGDAKYLEYMARFRHALRNRTPLVVGKDLTAAAAYTGDIYYKGAWVLHTLRWEVGDDAFFAALKRFATEPPYAYGLVSSADFEHVVAAASGRDIPWFWERYLHRAALPRWTLTRAPGGAGREEITLAWDDPAFELPLPVTVGTERRRLEMPGGRATFEVAAGTPVAVDPDGRVLADGAAAAR
jgi:aminopeptidase N